MGGNTEIKYLEDPRTCKHIDEYDKCKYTKNWCCQLCNQICVDYENKE